MKVSIPRALEPLVRTLRRSINVRREFAADRRRYEKFMMPEDGGANASLTGRNLEAQITKDYHRVEKGLALATPKRPFGAEVERRLKMLLAVAPASEPYTGAATTALAALQSWNQHGVVDEAVSPIADSSLTDRFVPDDFFRSRHSVRDFSDEAVSEDDLLHAATLALTTPSVCNRQPWRVRFLRGGDVELARQLQNGNMGFGTIPVMALISVDLRMFAAPQERNQAWIEGGLFSMTLAWALHARGLETCMLNMSVSNSRSAQVREQFGLDEAEVVVMMIAIGKGRSDHRVARSPRREVRTVATSGGIS